MTTANNIGYTPACCKNCDQLAVLENKQVKQCCKMTFLTTPRKGYRFVSLCCKNIVEIAPERCDYYLCLDCEKICFIDDKSFETNGISIFGTRFLTSQEEKLMKMHENMKMELAETKEMLRLTQSLKKKLEKRVAGGSVGRVTPKMGKKIFGIQKTKEENELVPIAESPIPDEPRPKNEQSESTKPLKKTLSMKKIWRRLTGHAKWAPTVGI